MEERMTGEEEKLYGNFFAACRQKFTGLNPRPEFKQVSELRNLNSFTRSNIFKPNFTLRKHVNCDNFEHNKQNGCFWRTTVYHFTK